MAPLSPRARGRRAPAPAAVALAVAAALLALLPAARASCAADLREAMRACDKDMHTVLAAARAGVSGADVAGRIEAAPRCCAAATGVFSQSWM